MTLIEVRNSDGLVGRCDANCYNAQHKHCDCICGGKNHGAGLRQAIQNAREMAEEAMKKEGVRVMIPQQADLLFDVGLSPRLIASVGVVP